MSSTVVGWLFGGWLFGGRETPRVTPSAKREAQIEPTSDVGETSSDAPLLEAIRAGSEAAFQQVFTTHYAGLVTIAQRYLGDRFAAEDVAQRVLWDVWRRREHLVVTRSLSAYLFSAVRKAAYLVRRRERVADQYQGQYQWEIHTDPSLSIVAPSSDARETDLLERARMALATLAPRDREVVDLRLQGLTFAEIGTVLGLPLKTVATRARRAIARLRQVASSGVSGGD